MSSELRQRALNKLALKALNDTTKALPYPLNFTKRQKEFVKRAIFGAIEMRDTEVVKEIDSLISNLKDLELAGFANTKQIEDKIDALKDLKKRLSFLKEAGKK